MRILAAAVALALVSSAAGAQPAAPPAPAASNPEMLRMFAEDQTDRNGLTVDWAVVRPRDEQRRAATKKLLADGALHTAEDFKAAAFVFQHGSEAADYLLAHSLAIVAVAKGDKSALFITSASLDRYLQKVGQKQIYGTQFLTPRAPDATITQEPYDRALISDALRSELHVPVTATQAMELKAREAMRRAEAAKKP